MILKTDALKTDIGPEGLIFHLLCKPEDNEIIETVQGSPDRIRSYYKRSKIANCKDGCIHFKISPDMNEKMGHGQWETTLQMLAREFGFSPASATVIEHKKKNRTHRHVVVSAYDWSKDKKVNLGWSKYRSLVVSQQLEHMFGHKKTPVSKYTQKRVNQLTRERGLEIVRPETSIEYNGQSFGPAEQNIAKRNKVDISVLKADLQALLSQSSNSTEFQKLLNDYGYHIEHNTTEAGRKRIELVNNDNPNFKMNFCKTIGFKTREIRAYLKGEKNHVQLYKKPKITKEASPAKPQTKAQENLGNSSDKQERSANQRVDKNPVHNGGINGNQTGNRKPERRTQPTTGLRGTFTNSSHTGMSDFNSSAARDNRKEDRRYGTKTDRDVQDASKTVSERFREAIKNVTPKTPSDFVFAMYGLNSTPLELPKKFIYSVRPEQLELSMSELGDIMFRHYHDRIHAIRNNLKAFEPVKSPLGFCYQVTTKSGDTFRDYGDRITSKDGFIKSSTASEIIRSAKSKGWKTLTITGSQDYKDEMTIQAELQGIKTNHELSDKAKKRLNEIHIQFNRNRNQKIIQDYIKKQQSSFDM